MGSSWTGSSRRSRWAWLIAHVDSVTTSRQRHYNYFRDYDPAIGRYVESDPAGLIAGLNTYGYVFGNPIGRFDAQGLDAGAISIPHPGPAIGGSIGEALGLLGRACTKSAILFMVTGSDRGDACSDDPRKERKECRSGRDDECQQARERDEDACRALSGTRYGARGIGVCMKSAAERYGECLRFGPSGVRTPLAGVDTPL
jgi:RHS repeat-associated protein